MMEAELDEMAKTIAALRSSRDSEAAFSFLLRVSKDFVGIAQVFQRVFQDFDRDDRGLGFRV